MYEDNYSIRFPELLRYLPMGVALMQGSDAYPSIGGTVKFYQTAHGTVVVAEINGLPKGRGVCDAPVFGFHIHDGDACAGMNDNPFSEAGMHYNPHACRHPYHAGDLPPLFGVGGVAFLATLTGRLTVEEILGKTVIIHAAPDDFTTDPAGNSGARIACGKILPVRKRQ